MNFLKEIRRFSLATWVFVCLSLYLGLIYFSIAASNIALGLAVFIFIIALFSKKISLNFSNERILLYLLVSVPFLITLFSVLHSKNMSAGFDVIRLRIPILIIPFLMVFTNFKEESFKPGFKIFVYLSVLAAFFTVIKSSFFIGEGILLQPAYTFFITPIQHPYFGIYLLLALVLIVEFNLIPRKIIRYFAVVLLILGIVLSTSRLVYILTFIYLVYCTFKQFPIKKGLGFAGIALAVGTIFISLNPGISSKFKRSFSYTNSPRLKLWQNAIAVLDASEHPFLGVGIGDYYQKKRDPYFFKPEAQGLYGYDPHSQFFDFYITAGYFGVFLWVLFIVLIFKLLLNQIKFSGIVFFIILAFSFTESILNRQYGVMLFAVFIPLILKDHFKKPS